jgi:hypothetical protein
MTGPKRAPRNTVPVRTLSRRAVLRGAGGIAVPLPFLALMRPSAARAATAGSPKRFVVFCTHGGTVPAKWSPTGTETNFKLSPILAPLAPHQAEIAVLQGISMLTFRKPPGPQHFQGPAHLLTGRALLEGDENKSLQGGKVVGAGFASGISVDQQIARQAAFVGSTPFRSLQVGGRARTGVSSVLSYAGPNQPLTAENSPYKVFGRIFKDPVTADPTTSAQLAAESKSILDLVKSDFERLRQRIGHDDRTRLEQHLETVRNIEGRLTAPAAGPTCRAPDLGAPLPLEVANLPKLVRLQMDLVAMALACDRTRIVTFMLSGTGGGYNEYPYTWLGQTKAHHQLSHEPDGSPGQEAFVKDLVWDAEQFAYLVGRLKSLQEESGTVLDSSLLLWGNELGRGNNHSGNNIPFVLAGRCGGRLRTNRYLKFPAGTSHNDLLIALLNAMDIPAKTFGDPDFVTGPLPGIFA